MEPAHPPNHALSSMLNPIWRAALFDPDGLRDWVRGCTLDSPAGGDLRLPRRRECAAAIDEERPYAYVHGYTAYRFGFRADVVTTWAQMKQRFDRAATAHGYWLLLEDMSLNLPDRENSVRLLRLEKAYEEHHGSRKTTTKGRAGHLRQLDSTDGDIESSQLRVLVTTGQERKGDDALSANRAYLHVKAHGKGAIVFKPTGGMFDLWKQAGLMSTSGDARRAGNAPGFHWPPAIPESRGSFDEPGRHGAPGKLVLIAEALIRRATAQLGKAESVGDAVLGAVWATDALELTGGRTPTTAMEALSLKHRFEVLTECQFSGLKYHLSIDPRLNEVSLEAAAIARWFHRRQQTDAKLNGEMKILHSLIGVLRNHLQFDEEQACLDRIRHLHHTLWMRRHPFRFLLLPLLRYIELLLSSFAVFVVFLLVWVFGLGVAFEWANHYATPGPALIDAISSFFSIGPPISHPRSASVNGWGHIGVACIAIVSGFLHLGVFISHLYSIASRR